MKGMLGTFSGTLLPLGSALFFCCAILPSGFAGQVVAWGSNSEGQTNAPVGLDALTVSAGFYHTLAVRPDGTVVAWGWNDNGQTDVPAGLSNVVATAAGARFSIALKADGTVVGWGDNDVSQTNTAFLRNVVAIAAGDEHGLALKQDGTLVGWGNNYPVYGFPATTPAGLSDVVAITASCYGNLALKPDGTIVTWAGAPAAPPALSNVIGIATSCSAAAALIADGTVIPWGDGMYGHTNLPPGLSNVVAITANGNHSFALKADGTVDSWGDYTTYQYNTPPVDLTNAVFIAAGLIHAVAVAGVEAPQFFQMPASGVANAGRSFLFISGAVGQAPLNYQWKFNGSNLAGANSRALLLTNVQPEQAGLYSVVVSNGFGPVEGSAATLTVVPLTLLTQPTSRSVYSGESATFTVSVNGAGPFFYQWYFAGNPLTNATNASLTLPNLVASQSGNYSVLVSNSYGDVMSSNASLTVIDSRPVILAQPVHRGGYPGGNASFRVDADGSKPLTYQWRLNGTNFPDATNATLLLTNLTTANVGNYSVMVSNFVGTRLSVDARLNLLCIVTWGNTNGYNLANVPLALTNVVAIAAGNLHSVALKADGRVIAWGDNTFGQTNVPANLSNAVAIAAAWNNTIALRSNGTVVTWGNNGTNVPAGLSNVIAVAAGNNHSVALKADGKVVAWSDSSFISSAVTNVPSDVTNVIAITAGSTFTAALKADRKVFLWGSSTVGYPVGMTNVVAISAGEFPMLALKADGKIAVNTGISTPPPSLSNVVGIAAGRYHALALKADGTVTNWTFSPQTPPGLSNVLVVASGQNHCLAIIAAGQPLPTAPLTGAQWKSNTFSFTLPTQSGRVYATEYKNSLTASNWIPLPLAPGRGWTTTLTDPSATNSQRFYRVRQW
jgi:alpha-tubulin suppressor-like RCC1 family protein